MSRFFSPALLACILAWPAFAAPPDQADPALAPWFESLRNPVIGLSCCSTADGHILRDNQWRVAGDHYQIRIGDQWIDVPPEAVLDRVDNPTGGAVAFYLSFSIQNGAPRVLCFVLPTMS